MFVFRLQLGDFEKIPRALQDFHDDIDDWSKFFKQRFTPAYLEDVNKNFQTQGGMVGGWDGLDPEYEEWKNQFYPGKPINVLKGRILRAVSPKGRSRYLDIEYHKRSMMVGINHPHAPYVNKARRFMLRATDLDRGRYNKLVVDWMLDLLKKRKLRGG